MQFESGIWRNVISNCLLNWKLLLGTFAMLLVASIASEFGMHTGGWLQIAVWMYLAVPAHHTALTGQGGLAAINTRSINWGFIGRALALTFSGIVAAIPLLTFIDTDDRELALGLFVFAYLIGELFVLSLFGTWLPAVVANGDRRLAAALKRGIKTFWYVFFRLLLCSGALLIGTLVVVTGIIMATGQEDYWSASGNFQPLAAIGFALGMMALSINVVLVATILSRGYLKAEQELTPTQTSESAMRDLA